jgi:hypothetical protein
MKDTFEREASSEDSDQSVDELPQQLEPLEMKSLELIIRS